MVTNECHLVSEQSNKQVFILSRDRNKNHSTYTLTLCILNAELRVTTPVEPVLCGQLSGMFHLEICSDLLTVGVYVMPLQRKVKTFIFCGVMCFPNQFLYSWLFIWELWLNLEWWTCARCAFIWNTVDMTPNSLYSLLLVFIRLYFFGSLPNLKRQEMGVSKIWHSFLWKEGRKCVIPIFFFLSTMFSPHFSTTFVHSVAFLPPPSDTHLAPLCISNHKKMKGWEHLVLHQVWMHCASLCVWQCFQPPASETMNQSHLLQME